MSLSFSLVNRIIYGVGCAEDTGSEVERLQGSRVLVISDPGIESAGLLEPLKKILLRAELSFDVFAKVEPDPDREVVTRSVQAARDFQPDVIIGMGGGSSLDIAKVTSVMLTNEGPIDDYFGIERVPNPGVPLILIPTTAGTGSEVTSIGVVTDRQNNAKKGIVSRHMYARSVILDPKLTIGLPPRITAMTGMDALVHAIESYTGVRATVFTDTLNLQAIRMIAANLRKAFANGDNIEARENMLYASCMTGMGFSNTQNGLAHAISHAIGGRFHLPHGLLAAVACPWVMEYNLMATPEKFKKISMSFGEDANSLPELEAARQSVEAVKSLLNDLNISFKLSAYNIPSEEIPALAKATLKETRLISNNPRKVTETEVIRLLESAF